MKNRPRPVTSAPMRVRTYEVLRRAIEDGVATGWRRAHKHTDEPTAEVVQDQIVTAILNEVCEWFAFDEENRT